MRTRTPIFISLIASVSLLAASAQAGAGATGTSTAGQAGTTSDGAAPVPQNTLAATATTPAVHNEPPARKHSKDAKDAKKGAPAKPWEPTHHEVSLTVAGQGISTSGEQSTVRQYDRESYPSGDVRNVYGDDYSEKHWITFGAEDVFSRSWQRAWFGFQDDRIVARVFTDGLTHRLNEFRQSWVINGQLVVGEPNTGGLIPLSAANPAGNIARRDLNPDFPFAIDRRVDEEEFKFGDLMERRGIVRHWGQHIEGIGILSTRDPVADFEHPQTVRAHRKDMDTDHFEAAYEATVGEDGAAAVALFSTRFEDRSPEVPLFIWPAALPQQQPGTLFTERFPSSYTEGARGSISGKIGQDLSGTLSAINRNRVSDYNGYELHLATFQGTLNYQPSSDWNVTAFARHYSRDTDPNIAFTSPSTRPLAIGVWDEDRDTASVEARFLGWRRHLITGGVQFDRAERPNPARAEDAANRFNFDRIFNFIVEPELDTHDKNHKTSFWVRASGKPGREGRFTYSAKYLNTDANRDEITRGIAGDIDELTAELGYDIRPDLNVYATGLWWKGEANEADLTTHRRDYTVGLQGLIGRATASVYYDNEHLDSNTTVFMAGIRPEGAGFRTGVQSDLLQAVPQFLPVESRSRTFGFNATLPAGEQWAFDAGLARTLADGQQPLNILNNIVTTGNVVLANRPFGLDGNVESSVMPVDTTIDRLNLGAQYYFGQHLRDSLRLDYTYGRWRDDIDPVHQNGRFNVAALAYTKKL